MRMIIQICTVLNLHGNQDSLILKEIPTLLSASMRGEREMDKRYNFRVTSEKKAHHWNKVDEMWALH